MNIDLNSKPISEMSYPEVADVCMFIYNQASDSLTAPPGSSERTARESVRKWAMNVACQLMNRHTDNQCRDLLMDTSNTISGIPNLSHRKTPL